MVTEWQHLGSVAERLVRQHYQTQGYNVIKRPDYEGGFDFWVFNPDPFPNDWLITIVEVKANTAVLTSCQKKCRTFFEKHGIRYKEVRWNIPHSTGRIMATNYPHIERPIKDPELRKIYHSLQNLPRCCK